MGTHAKRALVGSLAAFAAGLAATTAASAASVTYQRLLNPEDGNWLTNNRTYDGHRYSPLDQITTKNVGGLHLAFAVPLTAHIPSGPFGAGIEGTPLVDDGIMYMVDGVSVVYRIDLTSGRQGYINWIMDPQVDPQAWGIGNNKGVALFGDAVYSITNTGILIATDAATGEVRWQVETKQDPDEDFSIGLLALDGKVILGPRGDAPMRGRLEARSTVDGSQVWQFWSVPGPGEPGHETWPANSDIWQSGGSSFWVTGAYDPDTNTLYYGTSNPDPTMDPKLRAGDNLYSASTLALDGNTGKLKWYFQYTPQDQWDYDENGSLQLYKAGGETRIGHFGRNGFYYVLNATNGVFETATQYVDKVTWTKGIDPKTGKPMEYDPALASGGIQHYAINPVMGDNPAPVTCPNIQGGNNHWPTSFSDRTNLHYATAIEGCWEAAGDIGFPGIGGPGPKQTGSIVATDVDGKIVKSVPLPFVPYGGQLTTAGGLLFASETNGDFFATDDTSLDTLWSINLGSSIEAPPIAYTVGGKEYIAVAVAGSGQAGNLMKYPKLGDDPNAASLANQQRSWMLYFFTL